MFNESLIWQSADQIRIEAGFDIWHMPASPGIPMGVEGGSSKFDMGGGAEGAWVNTSGENGGLKTMFLKFG